MATAYSPEFMAGVVAGTMVAFKIVEGVAGRFMNGRRGNDLKEVTQRLEKIANQMTRSNVLLETIVQRGDTQVRPDTLVQALREAIRQERL